MIWNNTPACYQNGRSVPTFSYINGYAVSSGERIERIGCADNIDRDDLSSLLNNFIRENKIVIKPIFSPQKMYCNSLIP